MLAGRVGLGTLQLENQTGLAVKRRGGNRALPALQ